MTGDHVKLNVDLYLYIIEITEENLSNNWSNMCIGYLNSKCLNTVPCFKLYQSKKEYSVSFNRHVNEKVIRLNDKSDFELLVKINESLFNDLLKLECDFDYEKSLY